VGIARGLDRNFAVKFSFLISIPAVLGANLVSLIKAVINGINGSLIPAYLVGMLVAMVSGYFAIRLIKLLMEKGKFGKFAYYCWAVGAITMIASFIV
jgi:undecaprenyl-diphosphatase